MKFRRFHPRENPSFHLPSSNNRPTLLAIGVIESPEAIVFWVGKIINPTLFAEGGNDTFELISR